MKNIFFGENSDVVFDALSEATLFLTLYRRASKTQRATRQCLKIVPERM